MQHIPDRVKDARRSVIQFRAPVKLGAHAIAYELLARPEEVVGSQTDRREAFSREIAEFAGRTQREPDTGLLARTIDIPFPEPIASGDGQFRSVVSPGIRRPQFPRF
jgi:hypothetical protein